MYSNLRLPQAIPSIYTNARENPPKGWENVFENNIDEIKKISLFLKTDPRGYLPKTEDVFAAFNNVSLDKVKVVILGQDVYHSYESDGTPTSIGRAFATRRGYKVAPSLKNLFIELERSISNFKIPNHGDLSSWEQQGVLLLNTSLTVVPHIAESHVKINLWNNFMVNIFKAINEANPYCIYILLGAKSQAWIPLLGSKTIKLSCSHPSPFSFKSTNTPCYGSDIFVTTNNYLKSMGHSEINWNIDS